VKKSRRILVISAALVVACVLTIVLWPVEKEPVYAGKKLSAWVLQLNNPLGEWGTAQETVEAGNAIRSLGTNSLPWLLKWIAYEPPPSKRNVYRLLKGFRVAAPYQHLQRMESRGYYSILAFRTLGASANPAIPELNRMMTNAASYVVSTRARDSLAFIGEPALPYLLAALTNQWQYRYELPGLFAFMASQRTDVRPAVPILISLLQGDDSATAESSARALAQIGHYRFEGDTITDALIEAAREPRPKVRLQAVIALRDLGNPSDRIVPALINSMDDSDANVESYAIRMLSQWQSQPELVVPAILKRLKPNDSVRIRTQLDALGHFGPQARSAVPAILQIMDKPASPSIWVAASNAVWRIDPRALQK
jgi:hypothetical protein